MSKQLRPGKCPICGEPTDSHYRPFCSRRCADVDLHRWLSGGYARSGTEDTEASSAERRDEVSDTPAGRAGSGD